MKMYVRKPRTVLLLIVGSALASTAISACGSTATTTTNSATTPAATPTQASDKAPASLRGKKVVLVSPNVSQAWMKIFTDHIKSTLGAQGAQVTHLQDPYDPNVNVQNLNLAIAQKPDLVLEVPINDSAIVPSLVRAKTANVPVMNLNGPPVAAALPLLAGSYEANHAQLGAFGAQNIIEGLKQEHKTKGNVIVITGNASSSQVPARLAAFKQTLARSPYKLVAVEEDPLWDQGNSAKLAQPLFAKFASQGGIQAAYAMSDQQALGIVQAAQQAGVPIGVKKNGLIVSGDNCLKIGIQAIQSGLLYGTATQVPSLEGDFAARGAQAFLSGQPTVGRHTLPEQRVTAANIDHFTKICNI